jgi:mannose-6-phosphate isomerase-like protein (cupin superfamily)
MTGFSTIFSSAGEAESAPDGSSAWPLLRNAAGSMARFELAPGGVSQPVRHQTVTEFWTVLEGSGELWRRSPGGDAVVVPLSPGVCADIPVGVSFQFRADSAGLVILAVTVPPWPGAHEAIAVVGSAW